MKFGRKYDSKRKRQLMARLRERDGDGCCYCGREMDFGVYANSDAATKLPLEGATVEHYHVPLSAGGAWNEENCKLACRECNQARGRAWQRQRSCEGTIWARYGKFGGWPALTAGLDA